MPGLIGFMRDQQMSASRLLNRMICSMKHKDWYKIDKYLERGVALGRVHLGEANLEEAPIFNEDQSIAIIGIGELYNYQEAQRHLERKHDFVIGNDFEFALHLYEEIGEQFVQELNGSFLIAIWNRNEEKLILVNDRYGLRPCYYALLPSGLIFASEVKAILQARGISREINYTSVAEFFTYGQMIGNNTFFKHISVLPPGSVLSFKNHSMIINKYWDYSYSDKPDDLCLPEYVAHLSSLFQKALQRQMKDRTSIAVFLSGGCDSRLVLGTIGAKDPPIHSFVFGTSDCEDVQLAKRVAKKCCSIHHFCELQPDYLLSFVEDGVRYTDGMLSVINMHAIACIESVKKHADFAIIALAGDLTLGGSYLTRDFLEAEDWDNFKNRLFKKFNIGIQVHEQPLFFNKDFYAKIEGASFNSLGRILKHIKHQNYGNISDHFFLETRVTRFTNLGLAIVNSELEYLTPFHDNDFMDFIFKVPPELRFNHYIYDQLLIQKYPELARIPWQKTGLPIARDLTYERIRAINRQIKRNSNPTSPKPKIL